jgi:ADP-heptose:LPS heptosyltransferase
MLPKNTRKSIDHQKWAHGKTVKNHPKSNIITLKAPKKKPYKIHFFKHSKMAFLFLDHVLQSTIVESRKQPLNVVKGRKHPC